MTLRILQLFTLTNILALSCILVVRPCRALRSSRFYTLISVLALVSIGEWVWVFVWYLFPKYPCLDWLKFGGLIVAGVEGILFLLWLVGSTIVTMAYCMTQPGIEIVSTRRRRWTPTQKAALLTLIWLCISQSEYYLITVPISYALGFLWIDEIYT